MPFSSVLFVHLFLPVVLAVYWLAPRAAKNGVAIAARQASLDPRRVFERTVLDFYNRTFIDLPSDVRTPVHPHTAPWRDIVIAGSRAPLTAPS